MNQDSNGNFYIDVENVRITYKKQSNREEQKNWSESDVISIRAYKNNSNALHMGAEVEIRNDETILKLIEAICKLSISR